MENYKKVLEKITKEYGIEVIKDFVKNYDKTLRKQSTRINYYDEIAKQVYELVIGQHYSKTRAIDKIALENNINAHTVRNHCAKFDKEAKEFDFYSFGSLIDEAYNYVNGYSISQLLSYIAQLNNLDYETANIYYNKYKTTKKAQEVNINKFKKPHEMLYETTNIPF